MVVVVVRHLYVCSWPALPVGRLGLAVVVVGALCCELSLVVLSFMLMEHEAPGGSEKFRSICWCDMYGDS
jgi:hypothetical protein